MRVLRKEGTSEMLLNANNFCDFEFGLNIITMHKSSHQTSIINHDDVKLDGASNSSFEPKRSQSRTLQHPKSQLSGKNMKYREP